MMYVYLIYDEIHDLMAIRATSEDATNDVKYMAEQWYKLDTKYVPLDYNSENRWGWEGVAHWERREVRR